MAKVSKEISVRQYADKIGVDEAAIRRAIREGKIKKGVKHVTKKIKGKNTKVPVIIVDQADKEYGQLKVIKKPQRGVSKKKIANEVDKANDAKEDSKPDDIPGEDELPNLTYQELLNSINIHDKLPYSELIRRREVLGAAQDKMKLEQLQGILVEKSQIDKSLFAIGNELKKNLYNIPSRVVPLIRNSPNDVDAINILTTEINSVLQEFAAKLNAQSNVN